MPSRVEQNKIRRAGTGLRALDPERAFPGFTLFAPPGSAVYLIDLQGNVVHSWEMPHPAHYGCLTPRGTLLYNGRTPGDGWLGRQPYRGGSLLEADWNGRTLWEVRHPTHHHDGILLRNGNALLLAASAIPNGLVSQVRGGRPGTEADGKMHAGHLVEMTTDGRVVWEWRSWEHLDPVEDPITAIQDERDRWAFGNGLAEWPNGDIIVSFQDISTVITIDRPSGNIIWKLGAPPLSFQHAPTALANGNLLILDNGPHRLDASLPFSRVIEVNPATKETVWSYQDLPVTNFFTPRQGNAQRLPNGNTLICEAVFGRLFEVTAGGEVVWEYVNPFFGERPDGPTNNLFRAYRYSEEEIERARQTA